MSVNKRKALSECMQLFIGTADKYASIRKLTVKLKGAPWIDDELKNLMDQHN